jgi:tetratricopeptide (TPR) repeat protein
MSTPLGKWFCLMALLWSAQAFAAGPADTLPGMYRSDEFGLIELDLREGRVTGKHYGGGNCRYDGRRVIEGTFEGTVLVGRVLLCQTGAACEEDFFDFLGFYDPVNRTIVADIRPTGGGCVAPSLSINRWLKLKADNRHAPKLKADLQRKNEALAGEALRTAYSQTKAGSFAQARRNWLLGLTVYETNWAAYLGLGVSELQLQHLHAGIEALEHARDLAAEGERDEQHAQIFFNMACAYAQLKDHERAFDMLRKTFEVGSIPLDVLELQKELQPLQEDRKRWDEIVRLAKSKAIAKNDNR